MCGLDAGPNLVVDDGSLQLTNGRAQNPAVTLTTDEQTWADMASGKTTASSAAAAGALTLAGDPGAVRRLGRIFSRSRVLAQADGIVRGREAAKVYPSHREVSSGL